MPHHLTQNEISPSLRITHLEPSEVMMAGAVDIPAIPYLPTTKSLLIGRVQISHYNKGEVSEIFQFIQRAAKRGDNVGIDEFISEEAFCDRILVQCAPSTILTFRDVQKRDLQAVIFFHTSLFTRSRFKPFLVDLRLVTLAATWENQAALKELLEVGLALLSDWPVGYQSVMAQSFLSSQTFIRALQEIKFTLRSVIPKIVKHSRFGLIDSYVFNKELPQINKDR